MSKQTLSKAWIDANRAIADSPAAAYLSRVGTGSRRTVQQSMARLAEMVVGEKVDPFKLRWERLDRKSTVDLRARLKEESAPATANKLLSVLKGVLRAARDMGLMTEAAFQTSASLEMVKASPAQRGTALAPGLLTDLFKACETESGASGRRDAAMLAVFLCSGLRRAEAAALDVADYEQATGRLHIRGERPEYDRLVVLSRPARRAVKDWLEVRTSEPGPLLLPVDRGGLIRFRRMTDQAIYDIFGRIAARANVPALTLRDLRRAYVVSLIRAGKPLEEVQYLVGHASWFTTATYRLLASDKDAGSYDLDRLPYPATNRTREVRR